MTKKEKYGKDFIYVKNWKIKKDEQEDVTGLYAYPATKTENRLLTRVKNEECIGYDEESGKFYYSDYFILDDGELDYAHLYETLTLASLNDIYLCKSFKDIFKIGDYLNIKGDKYAAAKLIDYDLRVDNVLTILNCKIKNVSNPTVHDEKYVQSLLIYDDDTSKTIKAIFEDKCAGWDKWNDGDQILLIGDYDIYRRYPLKIWDAIKIEESDEPTPITREDEIPGYDKWRNTILSKDNQKCVCCGLDKHLEAHHLYGYKEHPELAIEPDNGVTLCSFCHKKYHSIYGVKDINPRDFVEFIRRFGV